MALAFGSSLRKKLTLSKQQRWNLRIGFRGACDSSLSTSNSSNKYVHFSVSGNTLHYTCSSNDYDRGSHEVDQVYMGRHLWTDNMDLPVMAQVNDDGVATGFSVNSNMDDYRTQQDVAFDAQCRRNTKINKKRGYHSVAILVHYRPHV